VPAGISKKKKKTETQRIRRKRRGKKKEVAPFAKKREGGGGGFIGPGLEKRGAGLFILYLKERKRTRCRSGRRWRGDNWKTSFEEKRVSCRNDGKRKGSWKGKKGGTTFLCGVEEGEKKFHAKRGDQPFGPANPKSSRKLLQSGTRKKRYRLLFFGWGRGKTLRETLYDGKGEKSASFPPGRKNTFILEREKRGPRRIFKKKRNVRPVGKKGLPAPSREGKKRGSYRA